jgi:RND family efflux transporter MFP subunit
LPPSPDIRPGLQRAAIGVLTILAAAFLVVFARRLSAEHALARETLAQASAIPSVEVAVVRDVPSGGQVILPGETAAWYESTIYARVSGYLAHWYVDIGDHVIAGQTLADIDTPELDAQLAGAQAKLQVAEAEVRVGAAAAELARSTYARWRDSPKGVVSEQERENKKAEDSTALARLEAARAEVRLDQSEVAGLRALTRFKRVTAPYAGVITQRRIDIGDLVSAGSTLSTTPLFRMTQPDPIRVVVDVPQNLATELMKTSVPAEIIQTDALGPPLQGTISRTADSIDARARTLRVQIDLPNPDARLMSGQYVKVRFALPNTGLHQVPAAALSFRSGNPEVAQVGPGGRVKFCPVRIARDDGATVELSSGVAAGDRVILNINTSIAEGAQVRTEPDAAGGRIVAMGTP